MFLFCRDEFPLRSDHDTGLPTWPTPDPFRNSATPITFKHPRLGRRSSEGFDFSGGNLGEEGRRFRQEAYN
jgi:hypothetical protein